MLKIEISGETIEQLHHNFAFFADRLGFVSVKQLQQAAAQAAQQKQPAEQKPEAKQEPETKPAGKKKAAEPKQEPEAKQPTMDDCKAALRTVLEKKDHDTAVSTLTKFGVDKCKDLKPEQFEGFIAACNEAVA